MSKAAPPTLDEIERTWRIEKMRREIDMLRSDIRWAPWKVVAATAAACAALLGVGVFLGVLLEHLGR